ncbi:ABC transporter permease [Brumimicrobium aurantiacum]|uniref:ABC transporter permease n=2 Tax=Brumimicrobium aurantiacum TaxID=1737063 RepID=A0A3E1EYT2_9FLAO|nr:ABC transporter permease [Brumimicrobium aurantiacum]
MTNRKIKEAGINPFFGYLLVLLVFILLSAYIYQKTDFAKYLVLLICFSLQLRLSEKNRTDFLITTFGDKTKKIKRVLENLIVCIPFVFILVYKSNFNETSILFLMSIVLALISLQTNLNFTIPTPFSKRPFEFPVGFRKTFFIFPISYVLTIIAIIVDNLNLGIFSMLLIFLTSSSFYTKPENEYYVWIHAETPKSFLKNKISIATKFVTLVVSPILFSLFIFYLTDLVMIFLFFLIGLLFLWAIIFVKYSAYPDEMNLPEGIIIALSLFLPPLLLIVIPYFYRKSINRLKAILND